MDSKKIELQEIFIKHTKMLIEHAEKHSPEPALEEQIRENVVALTSLNCFR